jgi:hypothetical protein
MLQTPQNEHSKQSQDIAQLTGTKTIKNILVKEQKNPQENEISSKISGNNNLSMYVSTYLQ